MINPRTRKLVELTGKAVRLSAADRSFLQDLSKVQIISNDLADKWHYDHQKAGSKHSLSRLVDAGILTEKKLHSSTGVVRVYQFSSHEMAKAWGGRLPVTGAKRTDFHELVTSRLYFELGRPDDFRLENRFNKNDKFICGELRPDAMYTNRDDEVVFVEADSGQYSKAQIEKKIHKWSSLGVKQVWGQPKGAVSKISQANLLVSAFEV